MNKRFLVVLIIVIIVLLIILTIKVIKTFSTTRQVNNYQYNIEENNQILNEKNAEDNIEKNIITVEVNNENENKVEQNIEESHVDDVVEDNVEKENLEKDDVLKDNVEKVPDEPEEIVEEPKNDAPQTSNSEFDSSVAFIGDSRTQAFLMYTGLKNVTDYTSIGLMVDTAVTKKFVKSANGEKVTILQDLKTKNIDKIYIMLGVNELRLGI